MFILGVILYVALVIFISLFGASATILIDSVSFVLVIGAYIAMLVATNGFSDLVYGFKVILFKRTPIDKKALESSIEILKVLFKTSISVGIIGTLIGLITMLKYISDPSKIGPSLSVALLSTLYGLVFAFIVMLPGIFRLEKLKRS